MISVIDCLVSYPTVSLLRLGSVSLLLLTVTITLTVCINDWYCSKSW